FAAATATSICPALDALLGARPGGRSRMSHVGGARFDVLWDRSGETFLQFHVLQARRVAATEVHFVTSGDRLHVLHRIGPRLVHALEEPAGVMEVLLGRLEAEGLQPA